MGVSVHSESEAEEATKSGADYLFFGPLFETPSHPGAAARGAEVVDRVLSRVDMPVVGIGGPVFDPTTLPCGAWWSKKNSVFISKMVTSVAARVACGAAMSATSRKAVDRVQYFLMTCPLKLAG